MGKSVIGSPTIEDPDEEGLGPAMLKLTKAQRRFVMATVFIGGSQRRCALAAGFSDTPGNPNSLEVAGHRLAHDQRVQEAMLEVGLKMLGAGRIPAVKFLLDTMGNDAVDVKDRTKIAFGVMDRTGMHAKTEHKMDVSYKDETAAEMIKQIEQMSKVLGVDPSKLLGTNAIEGEYEEVKPYDENSIEDLL